jgi:hypothetical protein
VEIVHLDDDFACGFINDEVILDALFNSLAVSRRASKNVVWSDGTDLCLEEHIFGSLARFSGKHRTDQLA